MKQTSFPDWLFFADSDLKLAEISYKEHIYHLACFHGQQAVEKMFKAVLAYHGTSIPKLHSLGELYEQTITFLPECREYKEQIKEMDQYYIPTRYPDALPGSLAEGLPNEDDAQRVIEVANIMREVLREKFPPVA